MAQPALLLVLLGLLISVVNAQVAPGGRAGACSFAWNNTYYVMGGTGMTGNQPNFASTPLPLTGGQTQNWTTLAAVPAWTTQTAIDSIPQFDCVCNKDGKVFVFGNVIGFATYDIPNQDGYGISILVTNPSVYFKLDTKAMTGTASLSSFVANYHGFCMTVLPSKDQALVCGGSYNGSYTANCTLIDPSGSTTVIDTLTQPQDGCSVLSNNDSSFMVIPGFLAIYHTGNGSVNNPDMEYYSGAGVRTIVPNNQQYTMPVRNFMAATQIPLTTKWVLYGGQSNSGYGSNFYIMDMSSRLFVNSVEAPPGAYVTSGSTPSSTPSSSSSGPSGGMIGGIVAGVAVVAIVAAAVIMRVRRSKRRRPHKTTDNSGPESVPLNGFSAQHGGSNDGKSSQAGAVSPFANNNQQILPPTPGLQEQQYQLQLLQLQQQQQQFQQQQQQQGYPAVSLPYQTYQQYPNDPYAQQQQFQQLQQQQQYQQQYAQMSPYSPPPPTSSGSPAQQMWTPATSSASPMSVAAAQSSQATDDSGEVKLGSMNTVITTPPQNLRNPQQTQGTPAYFGSPIKAEIDSQTAAAVEAAAVSAASSESYHDYGRSPVQGPQGPQGSHDK